MNWPRMAMAQPMRTALNIPGSRRVRHSDLVSPAMDALVWSICLATSSDEVNMPDRIFFAFPSLCLVISHRGLSGMKNITRRNNRSGMVS